jgi:hypothetical protein
MALSAGLIFTPSKEAVMYVWVNSTAGWVIHGKARISRERAQWVTELLERRNGWETVAGSQKPSPGAPRQNAPRAEEAETSPAAFD